MNNLIIGIAGGSGSGKTTLALRLKERFGEDEVRLISHDSYYTVSYTHLVMGPVVTPPESKATARNSLGTNAARRKIMP